MKLFSLLVAVVYTTTVIAADHDHNHVQPKSLSTNELALGKTRKSGEEEQWSFIMVCTYSQSTDHANHDP